MILQVDDSVLDDGGLVTEPLRAETGQLVPTKASRTHERATVVDDSQLFLLGDNVPGIDPDNLFGGTFINNGILDLGDDDLEVTGGTLNVGDSVLVISKRGTGADDKPTVTVVSVADVNDRLNDLLDDADDETKTKLEGLQVEAATQKYQRLQDAVAELDTLEKQQELGELDTPEKQEQAEQIRTGLEEKLEETRDETLEILEKTAPASNDVPPSVTITFPQAGATVCGSFVISAAAFDDVEVTWVEFLQDGVVIAVDTEPTYEIVAVFPALSTQTITISARAVDTSGNVGLAIGVPVGEDCPPAQGTVTGTLRYADGTPVAKGTVTLTQRVRNDDGTERLALSRFPTEADGSYLLEFVLQNGLGPFTITGGDGDQSSANVTASIAADGQRLEIDLVLDPGISGDQALVTLGVEYVPIWVSVGIAVRDGADEATTVNAVRQDIRSFLFPLAPGGPTNTGWPLGGDVRGQAIEVVASRVAGVSRLHCVLLGLHPPGTVTDPVVLQDNELPELTSITVEATAENADVDGSTFCLPLKGDGPTPDEDGDLTAEQVACLQAGGINDALDRDPTTAEQEVLRSCGVEAGDSGDSGDDGDRDKTDGDGTDDETKSDDSGTTGSDGTDDGTKTDGSGTDGGTK